VRVRWRRGEPIGNQEWGDYRNRFSTWDADQNGMLDEDEFGI